MIVKFELSAEDEASLLAQAMSKGLSLETYVGLVLHEISHRKGDLQVSGQATRPKLKKGLVELFEPLKGIGIEFPRNHSFGRPPEL